MEKKTGKATHMSEAIVETTRHSGNSRKNGGPECRENTLRTEVKRKREKLCFSESFRREGRLRKLRVCTSPDLPLFRCAALPRSGERLHRDLLSIIAVPAGCAEPRLTDSREVRLNQPSIIFIFRSCGCCREEGWGLVLLYPVEQGPKECSLHE